MLEKLGAPWSGAELDKSLSVRFILKKELKKTYPQPEICQFTFLFL